MRILNYTICMMQLVLPIQIIQLFFLFLYPCRKTKTLKLTIQRQVPDFIFSLVPRRMKNNHFILLTNKIKISNKYIEKVLKSLTFLQKFSYNLKVSKKAIQSIQKQIIRQYEISFTNNNNYILPVTNLINSVIKIINFYDTVIVLGDTGTGKTTQIPKIILKNTKCLKRSIFCSQPRRLAAITSATRVCSEIDSVLGEKVGYKMRFETCFSKKTQLVFLTDGMLLKEIIQPYSTLKISFILLDEVHERNLNLDLILGIIKGLRTQTSTFKLLIMSATIDYSVILKFFPFSLKLQIPGKTFPINIKWSKMDNITYHFHLFRLTLFLLIQKKIGDVLIFLTSQEEIECVLKILLNLKKIVSIQDIIFIPLFSKITQLHNQSIYNSLSVRIRKCILSTNICETSITLKNIRYVIDNGLNKIKFFHPNFLFDKIQISYISKSSAYQRSGRAGRTSLGTCFRLYTKNIYESFMFNSNFPEIKRANLSNLILFIKTTESTCLEKFDFLDIPPTKNIQSALYNLWILSMLENHGALSHDGKIISNFNLEPILSKLLINAVRFKCSYEILIIVSIISTNIIGFGNLFNNFSKSTIDYNNKYFSEFLAIIDLYKEWESKLFDSKWCHQKGLNLMLFSKIRKTKKNIKNQLYHNKVRIKSCKKSWSRIIKTLITSYFINISIHNYRSSFIHCFTKLQLNIHPNSSIYYTIPAFKYIVFTGLIISKLITIYFLSTIKSLWIIKYGKKIFKFVHNS